MTVDHSEVGRQIARAAVAAQFQHDIVEAGARAFAQLAVVELRAEWPALGAAWLGGEFATGGLVNVTHIGGPSYAEFVVPRKSGD